MPFAHCAPILVAAEQQEKLKDFINAISSTNVSEVLRGTRVNTLLPLLWFQL
jgi:hypothetical protein